MPQEGFKRKLTAIFSADVAGYSRLMGEDEEATVRTITAYREVLTTLIKQHNGKVVDSPGDNLLAEFASVVDAVQCAVAVQKEIKSRNDELPENRKMQFRIGINLGDVIQEEERIYGDGVNIAARLEGLSEPGGICVSKTAFDHIESKLPYGYEFLGDQTVKNMATPIGAYRVLMEPRVTVSGKSIDKKSVSKRRISILAGAAAVLAIAVAVGIWQFYGRRPPVEPASIERMAYSLPDKPSIAALPFDNLSGDPNQDYISDGISESIISALSKISEIFVIARNSTFYYKGKPLKVQQVAEELGVQHVLEGSIQRSGDRIRIMAQLVDAIKGHHLWSEKYDRDMRDLFDLLDEITKEVVVALEVKLTMGEQALTRHTTENLEAWGYATRAYSIFERISKEDNAKARELFKKAIELDPNYVFAWRFLGSTHFVDRQYGWTESRSESWKRYVECIEKALTLDPGDPEVNVVMGQIHLYQRQYDEAIARAEKAIALGPNNAAVYAHAGWYLLFVGRFEEAVLAINKATRLQPHYPWWYKSWLAQAYFQLGRYEDLLAVSNELFERSRKAEGSALQYMACSCLKLGREEEARAYAKEALELFPNLSLEGHRRWFLFKDPDHLERWLDCMRKVGIPEKPPLLKK